MAFLSQHDLIVLLIGLTAMWDQRGERARQGATMSANHRALMNCANRSVLMGLLVKKEALMLV